MCLATNSAAVWPGSNDQVLTSGLLELDLEGDLVLEAPAPVLAALGRADDEVAALTRVLPRVTVGGGVAAADVATGETDAEVQPAIAGLEAVLATFDRLRRKDLDLVEMCALGHRSATVAAAPSRPNDLGAVFSPPLAGNSPT